MSRFAQIVKLDYSIDRNGGSSMYDRDGRYAGMGGRTRSEALVTVRMELMCSTESVQWLQVAMGQGGPADIQDLAQSIGLEQPGRSKVVEPEEVGTCRARHASGMGCVNLANTHTTHCSSKGWKWQDTAAAACGHKRGSYVCVEPQGHDGNHTGGAGTSWPWTLPVVPRCGRCGAQAVVRVNRKKGTEFTACVEWPTCDWTYGRPPPQVVRCTAKQRVTDLQCAREVGHEGTHVTMGAPFGAEADAAAAAAPGYARRELELGDD